MIKTIEEYRVLAARTLNTEEEPYNLILHMDAGIKGESGELIDILKKHIIYGKELNIDAVIEEYGDIMWYVVGKATLQKTHLSGQNLDKIEEVLEYYEKKLDHIMTQKHSILSFLVYQSPSLFDSVFEYIGYVLFLGRLLENEYETFNIYDVLTYNIDKLRKRYPDKYSDEDAIKRKDKNEK